MTVRILVVDDEPRYLRLLEANLLTEGYQVLTAMDGEEAVESFSANPVDLNPFGCNAASYGRYSCLPAYPPVFLRTHHHVDRQRRRTGPRARAGRGRR